MTRNVLPLFVGKVEVDPVSNCWVWIKSTRNGYGQIMVDSFPWYSHRYSYTVYKGEIPEGQLVRHECNNTKCCNPDHLILGSNLQNWHDSRFSHRVASLKLSKGWDIAGERYTSIRAARTGTGLPLATITKYSTDGVFDVDAYRAGCAKIGVEPKV